MRRFVLFASIVVAAQGCFLNPQPEPPGAVATSGTPAAGGATGTGGSGKTDASAGGAAGKGASTVGAGGAGGTVFDPGTGGAGGGSTGAGGSGTAGTGQGAGAGGAGLGGTTTGNAGTSAGAAGGPAGSGGASVSAGSGGSGGSSMSTGGSTSTGGASTGGAAGSGGSSMTAGGTSGGAGAGGSGGTGGASGSAGAGGAPVFPDVLDGIWLIGWFGNLNHVSWVRFHDASLGGGVAEYLSGADLSFNGPYWSCTGVGSWSLTQKPDTIQLFFPASCPAASGNDVFTFVSFGPPSMTFPKGATLTANLEVPANPGAGLMGFKYAASWCDAALSTCMDPLQ